MAKKEQKKSTKRFPYAYVTLFIIALAGFWWIKQEDIGRNWKDQIIHYIDNQDLATLESRFTVDQIVQQNRQVLLGSDLNDSHSPKRTIQTSTVVYYPYLLLNVKYATPQGSKEGMLLWGMNEGEVVLNTETWAKTHGFRDCLDCKANRQDLKILQALAKYPQGLTLEEIQKELGVEREELATWIESSKQKHLITQKGNSYQLHFENPRLLVLPQTQMNHPIVLKAQGTSIKAARRFSRNEIINLARNTFGNDFTIRSEEEIYLPVYRLTILNPDESIQVSEWNALTGKKVSPTGSPQSADSMNRLLDKMM